MTAWVRALGLLGLTAALVGCSPCDDLNARLCGDLGASDCSVWQRPEVRTGFIKEPQWGSKRHGASRSETIVPFLSQEATICRAFARDDTYAAYTLPMAHMLVGAATGRPAPAPPPPPADFAANANLSLYLGLLALAVALALGLWVLSLRWPPLRRLLERE